MAPNFIETFEGIFNQLEKEFMKTKEPEIKAKIACDRRCYYEST